MEEQNSSLEWIIDGSPTGMGINNYPLPLNNWNLTLTFFGGSYPIVILDNIINKNVLLSYNICWSILASLFLSNLFSIPDLYTKFPDF